MPKKGLKDAGLQEVIADFLVRPRINELMKRALKKSLVVVCAGAGYGKTRAVYDYVQVQEIPTVWAQLSDRDNVAARFWENYVHSFTNLSANFAEDLLESGFPDSEDSFNRFITLRDRGLPSKPYLVVLDDFHLIKDADVVNFIERDVRNQLSNRTTVLMTREALQINLKGLEVKGLTANIDESDLNFTQEEINHYFDRSGIAVDISDARDIYLDTGGWAFAVNLIARSLKKSPGYSGYVRNAMKENIFHLMELEVFNVASGGLQRFLIRLSLVDHLSADLVSMLSEGDEELLAELGKHSAYIRFDSYINAYLIHHLFLDFLRTRQDMLSEDEEKSTFKTAADWCNRNGFKIDAMAYYEKIGNYRAIVDIYFELSPQVPQDIARFAMGIFNRTPPEVFDSELFLVGMHVRTALSLGRWQEVLELMRHYEAKYLQLPEDCAFRNITLGTVYYVWGILRQLMCTTDDRYDFDVYFARQEECFKNNPIDPGRLSNHPVGPWISLVGSVRQGAPREYIAALAKGAGHVSRCLDGSMEGADDVAQGELKFYEGDTRAAVTFIVRGMERARKCKQFELVNRALLYMMRIAVAHGDYAMAEQALRDSESQLNEDAYTNRFHNHDVILGTYYNYTMQSERVPGWLKEKFHPFDHTYFIENYGNLVKVGYSYLTRDYAPLLAYMEEVRRRETVLFGRLELLTMEACVHFKLKDRAAAFAVLREAYETAVPNKLNMPFIWLGKDMRTLSAAALRESDIGIPHTWLQMIKSKSSSYAKRYGMFFAGYQKAHNICGEVVLSPREKEILSDMYHGLSRTEISASRNLSVNTVKMIINSVYEKLNANNLADVIRVAAERKLF